MRDISQRYESDGRLCGASIDRERTPGQAAVSLFRYELGHGGRLLEATPTLIRVHTSLMGRYDITEFSGTEEEMHPLLMGIAFWAEARGMYGKQHIENTADAAVKAGLNKPVLLSLVTTMMFGGWVAPALCAAADLTAEEAEPLLERKLDKDTLDAILELVIDGAPFAECLAQATD